MKITLISLVLENFKGIQKFEFVPDGKSTAVFGTNASGKTTIADAYYWLLFGVLRVLLKLTAKGIH